MPGTGLPGIDNHTLYRTCHPRNILALEGTTAISDRWGSSRLEKSTVRECHSGLQGGVRRYKGGQNSVKVVSLVRNPTKSVAYSLRAFVNVQKRANAMACSGSEYRRAQHTERGIALTSSVAFKVQ